MNDWNTIIKKAAAAWAAMNGRCYNPKRKHFKYYGGKGVTVEMTQSEFMLWYVNEAAIFHDLANASIGRKDHSRPYALDNIEMVTRFENTAEMARRLGPVKLRENKQCRPVLATKDGETKRYPSISECARAIGTYYSNAKAAASGRRPTAKGHVIRYDSVVC